MDLQFHWEAFEFMTILSFMWLTMHLPLGLSSPLSSLLPFLNDITKRKKKATKTSHKKFSERKQVHVGMEASKTSQTRWE